MSDYTPPAAAVEAAAKVIAENTDEPGWSAVVIARAALTAAGPIIAAEALREAASAAVAAAAEFRAALAGSGEQPGEDECEECEAIARMIYSDPSDLTGPCSRHSHDRPAPVVPDSTDVVREAEAALIRATKGDDPTAWAGTGWWHVHRLLAVVGQGVTVEGVPEQIARYVEATATDLSPSGYRAGIATAVRLIRRWRPEYAAVRPSEKGQVDD